MYKRQILTGGRYGLGSKDTPPSSIFALFKELEKDQPKERFTLGITDDVTGLSLPEVKPAPITAAAGTKECKFWGLGGDGTVGANKNSVKIIGDHTDKYVQAYFQDVYKRQRYGSGVRVMRLGENDKVMVLARTDHDDEAQTESIEADTEDEPTAEQLAEMEAADEASAAEAPEADTGDEE